MQINSRNPVDLKLKKKHNHLLSSLCVRALIYTLPYKANNMAPWTAHCLYLMRICIRAYAIQIFCAPKKAQSRAPPQFLGHCNHPKLIWYSKRRMSDSFRNFTRFVCLGGVGVRDKRSFFF